MTGRVKGLRERLRDGERVLVAEGYLFELERRGYLCAGKFVPETVLEYPEKVKSLSEDLAHCGSDVILAFTYYGNQKKLGDKFEKQNRDALKIARQVADDTGTLMAGDLSNTTCYDPKDVKSHDVVRSMFKEQVLWAVEGGADMLITETMGCLGEAKLAVQACKDYGNDLPIISNLSLYVSTGKTVDDTPIADAVRELEAMGVDVVGLNCFRGPKTMIPVIKEVKEAVKIPVSCLPMCYHTDEKNVAWFDLKDPETGAMSYPDQLDSWHVNRNEITWFTKEAVKLDINVLGLCCGNAPHYTRSMAEAMGRRPPASKYSPDMEDYTPGIAKVNVFNTKEPEHV